MASFYCLRCESPVFRIISDVVDEYCCLRLDCANFKLSVRESATGISVESDSEEVVKTEPQPRQRLDSYPPHAAVTSPSSQPSEQRGPRAVRHRATTPIPEANRVEGPARRSDDLTERRDREWTRILQKPLSQHATDGKDPIAETRAWVDRPVEQRRAEVPADQRVKQPHNEYILYCKSYDETVRKMLRGVDQLPRMTVRTLAQSWNMETASVRAQFRVLATTEKMKHKQAFPEYYKLTGRPAQVRSSEVSGKGVGSE